MRSTNILGLAICLWTGGPICAAQSTPANQSPSWCQEIVPDLSRAYPGVAPDLLGSSNRAGVAFLDNGQLIVYAVEPTGHLSSRKSPEISSAFRLRMSLLDAKSGKQAGGRRSIRCDSWVAHPCDFVLRKGGAVFGWPPLLRRPLT